MYKIVILSILSLSLSGCATFQDLLNSAESSPEKAPLAQINTAPKYSDNTNLSVPTDRNYKRMTKNRMEDESDLGANAGSTWVMDGQGAYLFAQNKMRKEGDLLNVKLDGPAMKQVETKVSVIKNLLKQLEDQQKQNLSNSLAENSTDPSRAPAAVAEAKKPDVPAEKESLDEVQMVPTRLVEKLADGNYRVKGQQPFMIGKREYKVIVTGLIRPEDFNDAGISSDKLLDPQYDVVSIRRNSRND